MKSNCILCGNKCENDYKDPYIITTCEKCGKYILSVNLRYNVFKEYGNEEVKNTIKIFLQENNNDNNLCVIGVNENELNEYKRKTPNTTANFLTLSSLYFKQEKKNVKL